VNGDERVLSDWHLKRAAEVLRRDGIVAYPTEAVYGLGCKPLEREAVLRLLAIKHRPARKGLILIAADLRQLEPFLDAIDPGALRRIEATWPGPVTWLWPARAWVPTWLRGPHPSLAVRVTAHPIAAALCRRAGSALVSTSANRSGRPPARNALAVRRVFGDNVDYIMPEEVGGRERPTEIRDALTGRVVRAA
jgi:L-threonylcarbamoyladenylate synthase